MIKRKYKIAFILALIILISPFIVITKTYARDIKEVKWELRKDVEPICGSGALACFDPNNQIIYLNYTQPIDLLVLSIWHEIGHWIVQDVTLEQLQAIYGAGDYHTLNEKAANRFQFFVQYQKTIEYIMEPREIEFWREAMRG